jgi:hypothetical protein
VTVNPRSEGHTLEKFFRSNEDCSKNPSAWKRKPLENNNLEKERKRSQINQPIFQLERATPLRQVNFMFVTTNHILACVVPLYGNSGTNSFQLISKNSEAKGKDPHEGLWRLDASKANLGCIHGTRGKRCLNHHGDQKRLSQAQEVEEYPCRCKTDFIICSEYLKWSERADNHEEMQKLLGIPNLRTVKGYGRFPPTAMWSTCTNWMCVIPEIYPKHLVARLWEKGGRKDITPTYLSASFPMLCSWNLVTSFASSNRTTAKCPHEPVVERFV